MEQNDRQELSASEQLLQALHNLVNLVKIYQGNNQVIRNWQVRLVDALWRLMHGKAEVWIQLENGRFLVNGQKVPRRDALGHLMSNFGEFLAARKIGELGFRPRGLTARTEGVVVFACLLNECGRSLEGPAWLSQRLRESGIDWVMVQAATSTEETTRKPEKERRIPEPPGQRSPQKLYACTLRSLHGVAQKISVNQRVDMRKAARVMQAMVEEVMLREKPLLLAMSTIRSYDDYTFTHSVNVAILSLYIGRQLGLPRTTMECLGLCGLFHDLGKIVLPREVLNKSGALTVEEYRQLRRHSLNSARLLVQLMSASADLKSRVMIPAFEHHLKYDLSGYPALGWKQPLSLCGRILAIADVYDALTSPRVYRREAMSADRALGLMVQGQGTMFDPLILKVFIRMLGVYPIGTLLELDGGETALVSRVPLHEDASRPWVVLLRDDGRGGYRRGEEINLAERDGSGGYRRQIIGSAHPSSRNIQAAELLMQGEGEVHVDG